MNIKIYNQSSSSRVIGFNVLIRGGSSYESKQNNGISHLLEHLIVKKLQQVDGWVRPYYIDQLAGYTYKDRIEFEGRILGSDKDQLVGIVRRIFSNLEFSRQEFEAEKQVIVEELTEDEENEDYPYQRKESEWIYGESSLALPTGGTVDSVNNLGLQAVKDWHHMLFSEENCFVSIVGEVDGMNQSDVSIGWSEGNNKSKQSGFVPRKAGSRLAIDDSKDQVSYSESWYAKPMDFRLTVQTEFFTQLLQDYFYYQLREKGLCYRFDASTIVHANRVELTLVSWSDASKLETIQGDVKGFLKSINPIDIEDLERYKASFVGIKQLENTDEQLQAHYYNWYKAFCGEEYSLEKLLDIVHSVNLETIAELVKRLGMDKPGVTVLQGKLK